MCVCAFVHPPGAPATGMNVYHNDLFGAEEEEVVSVEQAPKDPQVTMHFQRNVGRGVNCELVECLHVDNGPKFVRVRLVKPFEFLLFRVDFHGAQKCAKVFGQVSLAYCFGSVGYVWYPVVTRIIIVLVFVRE